MLTVTVDGLNEVEWTFDELNPKISKRVRDVVNEISLNVQRGAKQRCPVDTGRLRSSIHIIFRKDGLGSEVGTDVEYAPYVEFGTKRMSAQPYLFPAWEEYRDEYVERMTQALNNAVEDARQ